MKQYFLFFYFVLFSIGAMADQTPGIVLEKTDGNNITIELTNIQSIKYKDGMMVINKNDKTKQIVSIDDISTMNFSNITTAIESIVGNISNKTIIISDLSGKTIFKGIYNKNFQKSLHGIYVINVDGKCHKVIIK